MKEPGKKPTYPIQWDSTKQRKAFFASDGFGGGIPHVRTGEYQRAWKAIKTEQGYEVFNPLSHAQFIAGTSVGRDPQSRIHRQRWNVFAYVIQTAIRTLPKEVRQAINQVIHKEGFRTD